MPILIMSYASSSSHNRNWNAYIGIHTNMQAFIHAYLYAYVRSYHNTIYMDTIYSTYPNPIQSRMTSFHPVQC